MYYPPVESQGVLLAVLVVAGWSFPGVFVRWMPQLNPWTIAILRLAIGFLFTLPFAVSPTRRADFVSVLKTPVCWVLAALMYAYYLVATAAFQNAPVGEVAVLIASASALALPLRLAFGVKPRVREVVGTGLAVAGVSCVLLTGHGHGHYENPVLGPVLALCAALCAATFTTGVRYLTDAGQPANPLAISTVAQGFGLLTLPFVISITPSSQLLDHRTLWAIPLGIFSTAIPTAGYAAAAGLLPPVVATMLNPMVAVTANAVAAMAIGEVPRIWVVPAAVLIIAGIYVSTRPNSQLALEPVLEG